MEIYPFAAYQIAELAIQIEDEGQRFYLFIADNIADNKIKDIFYFLAKQEIAHKEYFSHIAEDLKKDESPELYAIDIYQTMKGSFQRAKTDIFNITSHPKKRMDVNEALETAMRAERESIKFYSEIDRTIITKYHKVLEKIIGEEQNHLAMLLNVRLKANL